MLERSKTEDNPATKSCEHQPQNDKGQVQLASRNLHHFILVLKRKGGRGRRRWQRIIVICISMILSFDLIASDTKRLHS
jgi:hypothetical protein